MVEWSENAYRDEELLTVNVQEIIIVQFGFAITYMCKKLDLRMTIMLGLGLGRLEYQAKLFRL